MIVDHDASNRGSVHWSALLCSTVKCLGQKSLSAIVVAQLRHIARSQVISHPPKVRPMTASQRSSAAWDPWQNLQRGNRRFACFTMAVDPSGNLTTEQGMIRE